MVAFSRVSIASTLACTHMAAAFVPSGPSSSVSQVPAQRSDTALRGSVDRGSQAGWANAASVLSAAQSFGLLAGAIGTAVVVKQSRSSRQQPRVGACDLTACRAFDNELGVTLPMKFFDPLGLGKDDDEATFRRRRIAEIKNGRVAMLACMGYIAPEYFRWPGYLSPSAGIKFTDLPNGVAALTKMPAEGWGQIGVFIAFLELFPLRQEADRIPGDAPGCGKLGIPWFFVAGRPGTVCDPASSERSLNAEINNGRLAMVAITGMVAQNGFLGTTGPEMWLPSSAQATLRAFESELGVQSPTGFWDPVGFCADGDAAAFRRRRTTELKHGRVAMLATIGYIVPESYRFPGYLSPSEGLTFEDMPHGLAAISKVPLLGVVQFVFFAGFIERSFYKEDPSRAPGDYENAGVLGYPDGSTIADPEEKARRLNSELANGRLAMTAIMALFFQNGTVGSTGPDMWIPPAFVKPSMMQFPGLS